MSNDPVELYARLVAADAGQVTRAIDPITASISALDRAAESVRTGTTTATGAWTGPASEAFADRAQTTANAINATKDNLTAATAVLRSVADNCGQVRAAADRAMTDWFTKPAGLPAPELAKLADRINRELEEIRQQHEQALDAATDKLNRLQPGFAQKAGTAPSWAATAIQSVALPPPGASPRDIARWWAGLTPQQRDSLLAKNFDELGRMRGLPAEVLNTANRRRIDVDQRRFNVQYSELDTRVIERATQLGLNPNDEEKLRESNDPELSRLLNDRQDAYRRRENATNAGQRLADADSKNKGDGVYVLSWDPDGPGQKQGTMAVAFGNPDTAKNVAVCVPGTTATLGPDGFDLDRAANLKGQMDSAGSGNAVIQWLGYDAPDSLLGSQVVSAKDADDGAPRLVADVDGYRAAAEQAGNHQHLTVIGHSYGSTVVGKAGMHGLAADDIVFVGSPGVGASNADQLSAGDGHVWAGAARHDPVVQATQGSWFTEDGSSRGPYDGSFGARQFGAFDSTWTGNAHSGYYEPGSESLRNLGDIATGRYDQVSEQHWQDNPLPPEVSSNIPVIGNTAGTLIKDGAQTVTDIHHGGEQTVSDISQGHWGDAVEHAAGTLGTAAVDVADTAADVVVDTAGSIVETGKTVVGGVGWAWDHTLGSWF
ncbi:alpha/beta hydrolase [Kutzneria sp. NPDC052558]|uniref:alpha/beta hydrolase n=1 Tax=Kutzneria sp. NPDC052558 TaxID=3364121 RepID=UPI0037C88A25